MATLEFNANEVDPCFGFEPLPEGWYNATIVESEEKPTKAGNGKYLELRFEVFDGTYAGRSLWTRLNLENPSDRAVKIARAELSAICHAVGVMHPRDSNDLHNIPLRVKVEVTKRDDNGEPTNAIKKYEKRAG